jgi:hypothetical protein
MSTFARSALPAALLILSTVLVLSGCGSDEQSAIETETDEVVCSVAQTKIVEHDCNLSFSECSDQRLHELLCWDNSDGFGAYDKRLTCTCAEDQATYGTTTLEGFDCSSALRAAATIEAGFRACGSNIKVPAP